MVRTSKARVPRADRPANPDAPVATAPVIAGGAELPPPSTNAAPPAPVDPAAVAALDRPFDPTVDVKSYNCIGFALRSYDRVDRERFHAFLARATELKSPADPCPPGWVRIWMWEYDVHRETEHGQKQPARIEGHVVAGRCDPVTGAPPATVYCKYNRDPVIGPGAPESFAPPARELVGTNSLGMRVYTVRENFVLRHFVAPPDARP
ncbi:MAG: hypothetical protein ACAI43_10620 [Phycisphaerae bacterium]